MTSQIWRGKWFQNLERQGWEWFCCLFLFLAPNYLSGRSNKSLSVSTRLKLSTNFEVLRNTTGILIQFPFSRHEIGKKKCVLCTRHLQLGQTPEKGLKNGFQALYFHSFTFLYFYIEKAGEDKKKVVCAQESFIWGRLLKQHSPQVGSVSFLPPPWECRFNISSQIIELIHSLWETKPNLQQHSHKVLFSFAHKDAGIFVNQYEID